MNKDIRLSRGLPGKLLLALLGGSLLLIYTPPAPIAVLFCVLAGAALLLIPVRELALLVVTFLLLTGLMEAGVRLLGGEVLSAHYRPHEVLAEGPRYRPGERVAMQVPHGDLLAADPFLPETLAQPRIEVFQTDALGYRNDADYSGEKLLVVGDSFVAGIGSSQDDTITAHLRRNHAIAGYNLGFVAGPLGYRERIIWARKELPGASCLALFYFEGNDFQPIQESEAVLRTRVPSLLQDMVGGYVSAVRKPFELSRVAYGLWTRAMARARGPGQEHAARVAVVHRVAGHDMAFLRGYAEVVQRASYDDYGFIASQLIDAIPDLVVFIPDKYRIYGPLVDGAVDTAFPDAQWQHLERVASAAGIVAVNATQALFERAVELLPEGRTVFWRDDTHWNTEGSAVGAKVVATALRTHPSPGCSSIASGY